MKSKFDTKVIKVLSKESGIIIPIEKPIEKFYHHLSWNDRTIFSAKFGDGKTFFLNKFFIKYSDEFEVIKLFPVNYQVEDNRDIFELIKRDILLHLLANDKIENENIIDDFVFSQYYLFNNGADILLDLLSDIQKIKIPVQIVQKALKHFKKYNDFKVEAKKKEVDIAEEYILKFESIPGIYEYDSISSLITKCIQKIKESGKKVVLLIEDLDRIDPAHLFRILNVLTAHIDRNHILVDEFESKQYRNKFDFNNIITVFDYENTKKIFHHFYGRETCFEGYINKFITHGYFQYSMNKIIFDYVNQSLFELLNIPISFLENETLFREKISSLSIREIESLLRNTQDEIINSVLEVPLGYTISTNNNLSRFLVVLKRLQIDFKLIAKNLFGNCNLVFLEIIGVCWYLSPKMVQTDKLSIPTSKGSSMSHQFIVNPKIENKFIVDLKFNQSIESNNYSIIEEDFLKAVIIMKEYIK